jgi:hypothetical protein
MLNTHISKDFDWRVRVYFLSLGHSSWLLALWRSSVRVGWSTVSISLFYVIEELADCVTVDSGSQPRYHYQYRFCVFDVESALHV